MLNECLHHQSVPKVKKKKKKKKEGKEEKKRKKEEVRRKKEFWILQVSATHTNYRDSF